MTAPKRILVIGNGPSARRLAERGFHNLPPGLDTFGMGAAYRYFHLIGWWPTYYAWCDKKVVHSHRAALSRLIHNPDISTKRFFFSLPLTEHERFEEVPHSSTGDFCFKKAIELGYEEIYLIGVDGSYVEKVVNSRELTNAELRELDAAEPSIGFNRLRNVRVVSKTLSHSDNYFFPWYQMAGDVYSLPLATTHRDFWSQCKELAGEAGVSTVNLSQRSLINGFEKRNLDVWFDTFDAQNASKGESKIGFSDTVLIAFPTLRTLAEKEFWENVCRDLRARGYRPVVLSHFVSEPSRETIAGAEQYFFKSDPRDHAGGVKSAELLEPQLRALAGLTAIRGLARSAPKKFDEALAGVLQRGGREIAGALSEIVATLNPSLIVLNNDTHHVPLVVEQIARTKGVPLFFTERSPLVTNWVEDSGYYTESGAWRLPQSWADEPGYDEIGVRAMSMLADNPGMHRASAAELSFAPEEGAILAPAQKPVFLIAMDAVYNTGWVLPGHSKRALNYPMFATPEEAVRAIREVAEALGARLVLKPHPHDFHFNSLQDVEGVEIYKGSIEEALDGADVVFCFLTKVAFAAIARRKKVVTLAQNIAALSGVTFHCTQADEIEAKTRQALASEWGEAEETRARRFFGWLERDYFVANDLSNPGAHAFLERYFPPLPEAARTEAAPDLDARLRAIPGVLPRMQSIDPEGTGERAPSMLYGPFARADDFRVDEVDIVLNMFAAGVLKPERERGMMLDVGACKGGAFAGFAKLGWEVHAFEPNPPMHAYIQEKAMLPGVRLNQLAVSEKSGEDLPFYTSEESIGISSLSPFRDSHKPTAIVKTIRLDEYTTREGISHADFLKVDTEGFDIFVLKSHDWENIRPQVVVCEFEDFKTDKLGYSVEALAALLEARGYTVYASEWHPITRYGGGEHRWRAMHRWREGCLPKTSWGNLIAFRDPIDDAVITRFTWQTIEATRAKRLRKTALDKFRADVAALDAAVAANPARAAALSAKAAKPPRPPVWSPPSLTLLSEPRLSAAGPVLLAAQTNVARASDLIVCSEKLEGWKTYECAAIAGEAWFPLGGLENLQPATRVIESTADSVHGVMRKIKLKRAGAVELSGFVRAAGRNAIAIWAGEDGSGVNFDLAAARLSQMLPQGRHRILEAEMLRSAGEWGQWRQFRVVIWAEAPGAMRLHINLLSEPHAGSRHQGDGTSGVDLWGLHAFYPQTQRQSVRDAV